MGDMGDYWRDLKPELKKRREKHVKSMGTSALRNVEKLGFPFTHYESNHQFAIETNKGIVDYWGTTGTWMHRRSVKRGRGLASLRTFLED